MADLFNLVLKMDYKSCLLVLFTLFSAINSEAQTRYITDEGSIAFKSDAPLELIQAASKDMKGIIDIDRNVFAFSVYMSSFQGFNSPLQREHFNENYLETVKFPKASFSGKIIETVDWTQDGTYEVRTKGKLHIHGLDQERIIKGTVVIADGKIKLEAYFTVLLEEHQISIPKIMFQKIAEEIQVTIGAHLEKQSS